MFKKGEIEKIEKMGKLWNKQFKKPIEIDTQALFRFSSDVCKIEDGYGQ